MSNRKTILVSWAALAWFAMPAIAQQTTALQNRIDASASKPKKTATRVVAIYREELPPMPPVPGPMPSLTPPARQRVLKSPAQRPANVQAARYTTARYAAASDDQIAAAQALRNPATQTFRSASAPMARNTSSQASRPPNQQQLRRTRPASQVQQPTGTIERIHRYMADDPRLSENGFSRRDYAQFTTLR